jgi:hypothetical protein
MPRECGGALLVFGRITMRCMQFDDHDLKALRVLGFTISDDGEVAELEDVMRITILRPAGSTNLLVEIKLPNGERFPFSMPCADLAEAAGIEEDEAA